MTACAVRVKWTEQHGVERIGVPLRVIHPGEVPTVEGIAPRKIAKHRQRFIAAPSEAVRMLVRVTDEHGDRYYAPHVGSLAEADETREAVRK